MAGENELGPLPDDIPTLLATFSPIVVLYGLILIFGELQKTKKTTIQILICKKMNI